VFSMNHIVALLNHSRFTFAICLNSKWLRHGRIVCLYVVSRAEPSRICEMERECLTLTYNVGRLYISSATCTIS
jgi:hypothetical protein